MQQRAISQFLKPSHMITPEYRIRRDNPTIQDVIDRIVAGFSANYRGDILAQANKAAKIPDDENCSVWMSGLPPNVTYAELLSSIRDAGRVWASHIRPATDKYPTPGAKVTFMTPKAAKTLIERQYLFIRDRYVRVQYDRNKVSKPQVPKGHTRVLWIYGPKEIVNLEFLNDLFARTCQFQTEHAELLCKGQVINIIEWKFSSYRCQAQWIYLGLKNLADLGIDVKFMIDPCDTFEENDDGNGKDCVEEEERSGEERLDEHFLLH